MFIRKILNNLRKLVHLAIYLKKQKVILGRVFLENAIFEKESLSEMRRLTIRTKIKILFSIFKTLPP
mgnify:CR=1 FL=1